MKRGGKIATTAMTYPAMTRGLRKILFCRSAVHAEQEKIQVRCGISLAKPAYSQLVQRQAQLCHDKGDQGGRTERKKDGDVEGTRSPPKIGRYKCRAPNQDRMGSRRGCSAGQVGKGKQSSNILITTIPDCLAVRPCEKRTASSVYAKVCDLYINKVGSNKPIQRRARRG